VHLEERRFAVKSADRFSISNGGCDILVNDGITRSNAERVHHKRARKREREREKERERERDSPTAGGASEEKRKGDGAGGRGKRKRGERANRW